MEIVERVALWAKKRKEPFTEEGIKRMKCIRCGDAAKFQWQICSDGNNFRPICGFCDIELNNTVLNFMKHPNRIELIKKYAESKNDNTTN
jgi:hypothetical protein